jgi:hypothetical protein
MRQHAERMAPHADIFARVAPAAVEAQEALFQKLAKAREARHNLSLPPDINSPAEAPDSRIEAFRQRLVSRVQLKDRARIQVDSQVAKAQTLQPVRDGSVDGIPVLSEDRMLDIIGAPYPNFWISKSGNAFPSLQNVWANPADGAFGFDHQVDGTVTGRQGNSGAGIFVQFLPRIAPGVSQIRPFTPLSYQWMSVSFKSREDDLATLGVRVWSWDLGGGDMTLEQDYRYFLWNSSMIAHYFGTANSPSWEEDQSNSVPEWDIDNGFLWGKESPYFKTRANRIYQAAIWCFGMVWSVSPENRPGTAVGRLHAQVPWVVIGYQ